MVPLNTPKRLGQHLDDLHDQRDLRDRRRHVLCRPALRQQPEHRAGAGAISASTRRPPTSSRPRSCAPTSSTCSTRCTTTGRWRRTAAAPCRARAHRPAHASPTACEGGGRPIMLVCIPNVLDAGAARQPARAARRGQRGMGRRARDRGLPGRAGQVQPADRRGLRRGAGLPAHRRAARSRPIRCSSAPCCPTSSTRRCSTATARA